MPTFQYTSRKGVSYYLHGRPGRGGTTRYTLKRSKEGALAELPPGYEVVENVNGQASVRRARPRQISVQEEAVVQSGLAQHGLDAYRLEVKDGQITIFEPDRDPAAIAIEFNPLDMMPAGIGKWVEAMARARFGDAAMDQYLRERKERLRQQLESTTRYAPVLRFKLVDRKRLLFEVARMTYRGEGGWHALAIMPLATAVKKYVKHVGRDSFFELM
ncbi:MAG TPA: hypothetical protein VM487_20005 [Phycisphaerae bacterium]|nr:hypothetical protein [Phycisphaerae bacterium]